jgi:hypothetical protein
MRRVLRVCWRRDEAEAESADESAALGPTFLSVLHIQTSANSNICNRAFSNTDFLCVDEPHLDL